MVMVVMVNGSSGRWWWPMEIEVIVDGDGAGMELKRIGELDAVYLICRGNKILYVMA